MQNQPPVQVSSQPPVQAGKSSTGLDENVAALLSYIFTWVSGLIFFVMEKDSRLVRFHSMQAILLGATVTVIFIGLWIISFILGIIVGQVSGLLGVLVSGITFLLGLVFFIAAVIGWIMCLIKAYGGQYFKLPVLGQFAEKFSQK
jgi:uncharacterized membrane protein